MNNCSHFYVPFQRGTYFYYNLTENIIIMIELNFVSLDRWNQKMFMSLGVETIVTLWKLFRKYGRKNQP